MFCSDGCKQTLNISVNIYVTPFPQNVNISGSTFCKTSKNHTWYMYINLSLMPYHQKDFMIT